MKRLPRFFIKIYKRGDAFWVAWMILCIAFTLAAPWYLGLVSAVLAVYYYDIAMDK